MEKSGLPAGHAYLLALSAGMTLGLGVALASLIGGETRLPDDAVARVNGVLIGRAEYARALEAVSADKRDALSDADRSRVLQRLVDEELLLQHAMETGLTREVPAVRSTLVSAVLDANRAQVETQPVDSADTRAFYQMHREYFARDPALRLRAWRCETVDTAAALAAAVRAGGPAAATGVVGASALPVPDDLIPAAQLRKYLGRRLTDLAQALPAGETSAPLTAGSGAFVVHMIERQEGMVPPFEDIDGEVTRELQRRRAEDSLRELLDGLRESGEVVVADVDTRP